MAKTAADWNAPPKFPASHYVDSRIYTDQEIFAEEMDKLFKPSWIIACHESEIVNAFDYRLFTHPTGVPLILVRGDDLKVRSFYNICPHRGNTILYDPATASTSRAPSRATRTASARRTRACAR
jgi:methanesulfonate monooxygenase subunit alpha